MIILKSDRFAVSAESIISFLILKYTIHELGFFNPDMWPHEALRCIIDSF